jgi:hypothetical protein
LSVSVNPSGLSPGVYHTSIRIDAASAANPSLQVPIMLTVEASTPEPITPPQITSPAPDTVLSGPTVAFAWASDVNIKNWQLRAGSTQGAKDLYDSGTFGGAARSRTVSGLPTDGRIVWIRLSFQTDAGWSFADFRYTAAGTPAGPVPPPSEGPALSAPAAGSTLPGSTVTFAWSANGRAVKNWRLLIGSLKGGKDLYDSTVVGTTRLSRSVRNLPTDGRPIWVQLQFKIDGTWQSADYQYQAASQ